MKSRNGVCVWFTGLSGSGKTTTVQLLESLLECEGHITTRLDGDEVRRHLSKGLGFSRDDRETNVRRIGFVAAEIVKHGGIVLCAVISPYRSSREDVRRMIPSGHFVEVFVDTPLHVCELRDVKGLYAKARAGELKCFTGVQDPYEAPLAPEITLDTIGCSPRQNAERIFSYIRASGLLKCPATAAEPSVPETSGLR